MFISIGLVLLGLVLLVIGGEALLRGAVGLATLLRLTPAVIGLTVVAAGTSVPELAVSAIAAIQGKTDIAVANVVGSNIFNITVILGICSIVCPLAITGNTIKIEYPVLALVTREEADFGGHYRARMPVPHARVLAEAGHPGGAAAFDRRSGATLLA